MEHSKYWKSKITNMVTWRLTQTANTAVVSLMQKIGEVNKQVSSVEWKTSTPAIPRPKKGLPKTSRHRGPRHPFWTKSLSPMTWKCCASWWLPADDFSGVFCKKKNAGQIHQHLTEQFSSSASPSWSASSSSSSWILVAMFLGYNPHLCRFTSPV
jgi:hypothetical protein